MNQGYFETKHGALYSRSNVAFKVKLKVSWRCGVYLIIEKALVVNVMNCNYQFCQQWPI